MPRRNADVPTPPRIPQIRLYQDWLREHRGLSFDSDDAFWRWSVEDLPAFWGSIWDCFGIASPVPYREVLADDRMPGAVWFPGTQVNYVRQVLRHVEPAQRAGLPALIARNERGRHREMSWPELQRQVASVALHLRAQGLQPGDRVAAYLPNV
ncbi:MAG TPA: acetyl-coenzyme A synthetase N-terminal domain-containing protein, partial [Ramlibacter sp.]